MTPINLPPDPLDGLDRLEGVPAAATSLDPLAILWRACEEANSPLEYLRAMSAYYLYVDPASHDGAMCRAAADELEAYQKYACDLKR